MFFWVEITIPEQDQDSPHLKGLLLKMIPLFLPILQENGTEIETSG